ncbi:hypothetical protein AAC387_Pa07g1780 [Persea americana]
MELPQPRPYGAEGKKPTNDFLSLYTDSSFQQHQDPRPSQGFYLKTHDFLQPLERVGKSNSNEGEKEISSADKASSTEHILPGGIGTYSISHIPHFGRGVVKPEGSVYTVVQASGTERNGEASKANSNCSSYNGGAFTLWEGSAGKDKMLVKDKVGESHLTREPSENSPQFPPLISGNSGFCSLTSSSNLQGQKVQGFLEMMKSMKGLPEEEDDDDEDDYVKKEVVSSQKGDIGVKIEVKGNDQRANTPRSKHSATEQRRRSKINDRFQILRELIPHSDQKRDKASFLLEVIEYIQFLQEKVNKHEAAFPGWNQDNMKLTQWRRNHGLGESIADHSQALKNGASPGLMFAGKLDGNHIAVTPSMLGNLQNPVESDNLSTGTRYKALDHHTGLENKAASVPIRLQQNLNSSVGRNNGVVQPRPRLLSDAENIASQSQQHLWQRSCPADSDVLNEQEDLAIEGGTIQLSSVYSQGLLSSLTHALQSSGIDLSQASISVQIDLGKRAISRPTTASSAKDHGDPSSCNRAMPHSRVASSGEDSEQTQKRPRTDNR